MYLRKNLRVTLIYDQVRLMILNYECKKREKTMLFMHGVCYSLFRILQWLSLIDFDFTNFLSTAF